MPAPSVDKGDPFARMRARKDRELAWGIEQAAELAELHGEAFRDIEEDERLWKIAVLPLLGLTPLDGDHILDLQREDPSHPMRRIFGKMIASFDFVSAADLAHAESAIQEYEAWALKVSGDQVMRRFLAASTDDSASVKRALLSAGAKVQVWHKDFTKGSGEELGEPEYVSLPEGKSAEDFECFEIQGGYLAESIPGEIACAVEEGASRVAGARELIVWLRELGTLKNRDLRRLAGEAAMSLFERAERELHGFSFIQSRRTTAGYLLSVSKAAPAVAEQGRKIVGMLREIDQERDLLPLHLVLEPESFLEQAPELISLVRKIGSARQFPALESEARRMPKERARVLWRVAAGNPERAKVVMKLARHAGGIPVDLSAVLIDENDTSFLGSDGKEWNVVDEVARLSAIPACGAALCALLAPQRGLEYVVRHESLGRILAAIERNPAVSLGLVNEAITAIKSEDDEKLEFLLRAADSPVNQDVFRQLLSVYEKAGAEAARSLLSLAGTPKEFAKEVKKISGAAASGANQEALISKRSHQRQTEEPWRADMRHILRGVFDAGEIDARLERFSLLPSELRETSRRRFRKALAAGKESFDALLEFASAPELQTLLVPLLGDSELFGALLKELQGGARPLLGKLSPCISNDQVESLRLVRLGLRGPQLRRELPTDLQETSEAAEWLEFGDAKRAFRRFHLWGEHLNRGEVSALQEIVRPLRLTYHDGDYRVSRSMTEIGPDDAVFWVTTCSNHSAYYYLKRDAAKQGAGFFHLRRRSVAYFSEVLRAFAERVNAAS